MAKRTRLRLSILGAVLLLSTTANGQVIQGSIAGTITDESGSALPGVTVTVTSSALQVPELIKTSGGRGDYEFLELPAGAYRVTYSLAGFRTLVRDEITLTTGFAAR